MNFCSHWTRHATVSAASMIQQTGQKTPIQKSTKEIWEGISQKGLPVTAARASQYANRSSELQGLSEGALDISQLSAAHDAVEPQQPQVDSLLVLSHTIEQSQENPACKGCWEPQKKMGKSKYQDQRDKATDPRVKISIQARDITFLYLPYSPLPLQLFFICPRVHYLLSPPSCLSLHS